MADLDQIYAKLEDIDGKVDELLIWKAAHITQHKTISRDIDDVRETLYENPGLKARVQTLWNGRKHTATWQDFWLFILRYLIAAAIVGITIWFLSIYKGS